MALFRWGMWPHRNWEEMDPVTRLFDQNFGLGLRDDDLLAPASFHPFYIRLRRPNSERLKSGMSEVVNDKEKFQVGHDLLSITAFFPSDAPKAKFHRYEVEHT